MNTQRQQRRNTGDYSTAQREYEQALAAYNRALKKLADARNRACINRMTTPGLMASGSKIGKIVGTLNMAASPVAIRDAEREVEIARQRLERAKARINHSEW